jgi:hypothetical protein
MNKAFRGSLGVLSCALIFMCISCGSKEEGPIKVSELSVPHSNLSVALFCSPIKAPSRFATYDGAYLYLGILGAGGSNRYYDVECLYPGAETRFAVFWYPSNMVLRFERKKSPTLKKKLFDEMLVDLNASTLEVVWRDRLGTYCAPFCMGTNALVAPPWPNNSEEEVRFDSFVAVSGESEERAFLINGRKMTLSTNEWTRTAGIPIGDL